MSGFWVGGQLMKEVEKNMPDFTSVGLLVPDITPFVNTPEIVKKMPKKDLAEVVWRLQAALGEQAEITKYSQQEFERLQNEKILCRICFVADINVVLLPCRHHILCCTCSDKCKKCQVCRVPIDGRMSVYDV